MAEQDNNSKNPYKLVTDPGFRIKPLEEMGQRNNLYDGLITSFREDGTIPPPMKSLDELNSVREKAPIYYGRGGEKYGATTILTPEAKQRIKVDMDPVIPKELMMELQEEDEKAAASYSPNGLNIDYLESLLEEEPEVETPAEDEDIVEGMSEAQLRIQQAIFGDFEEDIDTQKKEKVQAAVRVGRAARVQQMLVDAGEITTNSGKDETANTASVVKLNSNVDDLDLQPNPSAFSPVVDEKPRYLSRMELAKLSAAGIDVNAPEPTISASVAPASNENEAVILKERNKVTTEGVLKEMIIYGLCFLFAIGLSFFLVKYVGQKTVVSGSSMNDTLSDGDQLIIDKISYRMHDPERYDIIVFPESPTKNYVKRIIGMPGETISIVEGYIYIDGHMLGDDQYGKESIFKDNYGALADDNSITLGENEYFVLGDNRNNSTDSRSYEVGNVSKNVIIGKVAFRVFPLDQFGGVEK